MAEQGARDFRPPEDGGDPPPLDRPTQACALVAPLLGALLRLAAQHLQASNLASFDTEARELLFSGAGLCWGGAWGSSVRC